jgi:hypothetical protein
MLQWKIVAVKVAVSHTVRHQLMTPQQQQQATAGMLATARMPAATGTPAFKQGTPAGEGTWLNLNSKNATNSRICVEKLKVAGNEAREIWL